MAAPIDSASSASSSAGSASSNSSSIDPLTRNALRYSLSPREYKRLHKYLISRAPPPVKKRVPHPYKYEKSVEKTGDYNAAAVRASLRVFGVALAGLKGWDLITEKVLRRGKEAVPKAKTPFYKSENVRLSASLSLILLFHRLLYRFFTRLRASLLTDNAKHFRRRNPRVSAALTSKLAPAVGAAFAGFWLGLYPAAQLRLTIAIYMFSRALEFGYNNLEDLGYLKNKPWWFGSWMIMPAACGQLLHAFVFDRDCFPATYGNFILKRSGTYIQSRPADYPKSLPWPGTYEIVDNLAEISKLGWPPFISPILFPAKQTLPRTVLSIKPITSSANPALKNLSCALLHPHDTSCLRTYITFFLKAFPSVAKFFTVIFGAFSLLRYKSFMADPVPSFNRLAKSILRMSMFVTGAIGTSWGSICLFQNFLPRKFLPTQRWFLGGFLGGLWAFLERGSGRSNFLYSARLSMDSLWKVGVKRGWWKGIKNGDVLVFVASLAVIQSVYETNPKAVSGGVVRKGLGMLRGDGWVDRAVVRDEAEARKVEEREVKQQGAPLDDPQEKKD